MNKKTFLSKLRSKLTGVPQADVEDRLLFYGEMIDDRMEEGMSEEEAVRSVGSAEEIAEQILAETRPERSSPENPRPEQSTPVKRENESRRRWDAWEVVLLAVGAPVWVSLLLAVFSVVVSVYVSVWAVIVSFWAVFASFVACTVGFVIAGVVLACVGKLPVGLALISGGLVCAGLSFLSFFGCALATKGVCKLTKLLVEWLRKRFAKKEAA